MRKTIILALGLFLLIFAAAMIPLDEGAQSAMSPALYGVSVVIDAGHGGWDPGKVGEEQIEKDINLSVARKLAEYCRSGGASVTLTREGDAALAEAKREDMELRVQLTELAQADVFISLHCNSFTSGSSQHGAQCFYQRDNEQGQLLAEYIQAAFKSELGNTDRSALTHPDSFLLKNIEGAAVICEMGFLSNSEEEELLADEDYQWQIAWSVYSGLIDYLRAGGNDGSSESIK